MCDTEAGGAGLCGGHCWRDPYISHANVGTVGFGEPMDLFSKAPVFKFSPTLGVLKTSVRPGCQFGFMNQATEERYIFRRPTGDQIKITSFLLHSFGCN